MGSQKKKQIEGGLYPAEAVFSSGSAWLKEGCIGETCVFFYFPGGCKPELAGIILRGLWL